MQRSYVKIKHKLIILISLASICLSPALVHAISYSTPGYNVVFYDDAGCTPTDPDTCTKMYELIATIPVDPFTEAGVFTLFISGDKVPDGADYFSAGFTGYSYPTDVYQGKVAFDNLDFTIGGSSNLLLNPGAEAGTTGWVPFAEVPDFSFTTLSSTSFSTMGGEITLLPVGGSSFFLIGGTSPSSPLGTGFGGFMNTPLISIAGLTGGYTLYGHTAIEAVPEPGTLILLISGLVGLTFTLFLKKAIYNGARS